MPVCGDRLSIDQQMSILSIEHAQVDGPSLASQVFFVPSFCHSCMGKMTFWTSIWMQFPENISRAKVLLQLFFWLWFYSSFSVCFCFFLFIFPAEIHSVCIDNIMKKCRIPFIFFYFRFIYLFSCVHLISITFVFTDFRRSSFQSYHLTRSWFRCLIQVKQNEYKEIVVGDC